MGTGAVEREARIENIVNEEDISAEKVTATVVQATNFPGGAGALIAGDIPKFDFGVGIKMAEEINDKKDTAFEQGDDGEGPAAIGLANG